MTDPITIAHPTDDPVGTEIERRVIRFELARRGVGARVRFVDSDDDADVPADDLFGDRHPPLAVIFWRTLDPRAVDVRSRMLGHLGLLGRSIGDLDGLHLTPTDRWIIANATDAEHASEETAALRLGDPRRQRATEMLDRALDLVAGRIVDAAAIDVPATTPTVSDHGRRPGTPAAVEITASPAPAVEATSTDLPAVSFVVVTYGTGPIVVDALAALAETADRPFEIVVVDNPHPDRPGRSRRQLLLRTRGVRLVTPDRNLGFGGGCELGILHARGEVLGLINPDLEVGPGWLRPLVDALDDADVAVAAPVLLDPDGCVQEAGQRLTRDLWTSPQTRPERADRADFASAACWITTRRWHERVGGFDPAFHPAYFEDADYVLRARDLGGRLHIVPGVRTVHHRGGSTDALVEPTAQHATFVARWATTINR